MKTKEIYGLIMFLFVAGPLTAQIVLPSESDGKSVITQTKEENKQRDDWSKYYAYPSPEKKRKYNIAVLTPLFLDSVDISKNPARLPDFMMPGIDFYQGVEIAADTLRKKGFHFDIHVFDSKSKYLDIENLIASDKLDSMDLIIGNAGVKDLEALAIFAKKKEINFVSAVSPSDAGQVFNPFFTILQPRLQSHIEEIHRMINKKYPEDNLLFLYHNKEAEQNALKYFKEDIANVLPGRFKEYEIGEKGIVLSDLLSMIDTSYGTTVVLASLNPTEAYKNLKSLAPLTKSTSLKVFGMPTMEMINTLNKTDEFPKMKIFYTTAFVKEKLSPATNYILAKYKKRMQSSPTDLVYKGFESIYYFAHLMEKYGVPFNKHLSDNRFAFLTPYKILPVKNEGIFQFFENKYMYILSYENGIMTYE